MIAVVQSPETRANWIIATVDADTVVLSRGGRQRPEETSSESDLLSDLYRIHEV